MFDGYMYLKQNMH